MIYIKNTKEKQTIYIPRTELYTEQYVNPVKTYEEGYNDGFDKGVDKGIEQQKSKLETIVINDNGTYEREDGYNNIEVNVPDLNGSYDDGYADGKNDGYNEGKDDGYNEGYDVGYTDGGDNQKSKLEIITITENGSYSREDGYSNIEVNVPDVNGSYDDGYKEGYKEGETDGYNDGIADGFSDGYNEGKDVGIEEQKSKLEFISIRKNGAYTKEDGYNEINVDVKLKTKLPNGISFGESTFTDFPVDDYDWSIIRDATFMFCKCPNLNAEPIIERLNDGTIPTLCTQYMFYGSKVKKIENMDFTKYPYVKCMFLDVTDLEEVKNCLFPSYLDTGVYSLIRCSNKAYKIIDCDFSNLTENKYPFENWYFCKFKNFGKNTQLPNTKEDIKGTVVVMECDMPDTFNTSYLTSSYIWYDNTKYSGWDVFSKSHPFGFYYNVIAKNPINIKIKSTNSLVDYEEVIPYVEEKGCYYIDYPCYMNFDVYLNGERIEVLKDKFNTDIYIPSTNKGVYEGSDIQNLIYYIKNDTYVIKDEGLFTTLSYNLDVQDIITPTDNIKITVTAGQSSLFVRKNITVEKFYTLDNSKETEIIIDTSDCDYITLALYVNKINNTYIKKIEIL
jgi:flagellar biosynthesis/type III secretory pathway protein FliH